jgi:penicillin G amidase
MAVDHAAPLIFWAWQRHLAKAVLADDLTPALWERSLATRSFQDTLEDVLQRDDASWCDDRSTAQPETCAEQSDVALSRALEELSERWGPNVGQWQWGHAHQAKSEHRPFSRVPLLAPYFELRTPVGGDSFTVNVSRVGLKPDATTGELYLDEHGPSLRALYDLSDPNRSRFMHSTGQSGIMFSPLYRSFVERWGAGLYVPVWPQEPPHDVLVVSPDVLGLR